MTETETSDTAARGFCGADTHEIIWPSILYFGTPIALVTTLNADGSPNIGPMSSAWALGYTVVMGWESTAHTLANLEREREYVINLPDRTLVEPVEALAPLTGSNPPATHKADKCHFEPRKFDAASLTEQASETVKPPRIAECPLQFEAKITAIHEPATHPDGAYFRIVEAHVQRVHALSVVVQARHQPHRSRPLAAPALRVQALLLDRHRASAQLSVPKTDRARPARVLVSWPSWSTARPSRLAR
jgi:flavin reductase (DIM6/NTAB) family NADH-FMN oxidoreductase RutF